MALAVRDGARTASHRPNFAIKPKRVFSRMQPTLEGGSSSRRLQQRSVCLGVGRRASCLVARRARLQLPSGLLQIPVQNARRLDDIDDVVAERGRIEPLADGNERDLLEGIALHVFADLLL